MNRRILRGLICAVILGYGIAGTLEVHDMKPHHSKYKWEQIK